MTVARNKQREAKPRQQIRQLAELLRGESRETIPYAKSIILSLITTHREHTILPLYKNSLTG